MTNTNLLAAAIKAKGLTQQDVAEVLNITLSTFNYKLNNKSEFKASEIMALCTMLDIIDVNSIFFRTM
jgi:transcriptional regulator with XRE-family HTH domain